MTSRTPGDSLRVEPPAKQRRTHVPQMVVALFLIAGFALLAVFGYSQATARTPVVALAVDVMRGQQIEGSMLEVVYVSTDDPISFVTPQTSPEFFGRRAIADLSAGTLLSPSLFVANTTLARGEAVVGLALAPGEYPSPFLSPGDHVAVVRVVRDTTQLSEAIGSVNGTSDEGEAFAPADLVLVTDATVFDVSVLVGQGELFVSLRLSDVDAPLVAAADAAGVVRLIQIPGAQP